MKQYYFRNWNSLRIISNTYPNKNVFDKNSNEEIVMWEDVNIQVHEEMLHE